MVLEELYKSKSYCSWTERKEAFAVSVLSLYMEIDTMIRDEQDHRPHPRRKRRPRQTGKNPSKVQAIETKPMGKMEQVPLPVKNYETPSHVIIGILPYVRITIPKQDAHLAS